MVKFSEWLTPFISHEAHSGVFYLLRLRARRKLPIFSRPCGARPICPRAASCQWVKITIWFAYIWERRRASGGATKSSCRKLSPLATECLIWLACRGQNIIFTAIPFECKCSLLERLNLQFEPFSPRLQRQRSSERVSLSKANIPGGTQGDGETHSRSKEMHPKSAAKTASTYNSQFSSSEWGKRSSREGGSKCGKKLLRERARPIFLSI